MIQNACDNEFDGELQQRDKGGMGFWPQMGKQVNARLYMILQQKNQQRPPDILDVVIKKSFSNE